MLAVLIVPAELTGFAGEGACVQPDKFLVTSPEGIGIDHATRLGAELRARNLLPAKVAAGALELLSGLERLSEIRPLADALSLPLHLVQVAGIATPTQSARILALHATGSVAEAAAIAAGGHLTHPRRTFGPVTIAIAEVP